MKKKRQSVLPVGRSIRRKKPSPEVVAAKKVIRNKQPIHRRIALQPIIVMMLLCVGVMLAAFTMNALADSITVTATVPAPGLTVPAVITDPTDGSTTGSQDINVVGTCPDNSYVNLSNNGYVVGSYNCTANTFQIGLELSLGTNQLQVQDYNITNSAGPTSPSIIVTYTPQTPVPADDTSGGTVTTTQPSNASSSAAPATPIINPTAVSPTATPDQLVVTQVDLSIPYISQSLTPVVSYQPTLTGTAPPYSYVVIIIHSDFYTCTTYATSQGYWSCSVPSNLPSATHTVNVSAKTPQGSDLTYPPFTIKVVSASPAKVSTAAPFHISSDFSYNVETIGQTVSYTMHMTGGRAPYAYTIQWGDGSTSTMVRQTSDDFTISHKYSWVDASIAQKVVKVQAIDASGQSSTLQLDAIIRNPSYHSAVANVTRSSGLWGIFGGARPWLWLLWPGYIIVMLVVFSFWLGEREELANVLRGKHAVVIKNKHHLIIHR
jgi:hypothetical protein